VRHHLPSYGHQGDSVIASELRIATESDLPGIIAVHKSAFTEEGETIASLVADLLGDDTAAPWLSLVAEIDGRIVGHVLFTAVRLSGAERTVSAQILAPLAVAPEYQDQGIGGALIGDGLKRLATSGVKLVFVLGHPDYYPQFGFRPAGTQGFEAPYPIPCVHAAAWMVQELRPGIIGSVHGRVRCADTLNDPRYWQE